MTFETPSNFDDRPDEQRETFIEAVIKILESAPPRLEIPRREDPSETRYVRVDWLLEALDVALKSYRKPGPIMFDLDS